MGRRIVLRFVPLALAVGALLSVTALQAPPASAQTIEFVANINAEQSTTGCAFSGGTGTGTFSLNTTTGVFSYNITFSGLSSAEREAHVHGPAPIGQPAGIVFPLPLGSPKIGSDVLTPSEQDNLLDTLYYVNIHSANCLVGEIRGQIVKTVGGIAEVAPADETAALASADSSGLSGTAIAAISAGSVAAALALTGAGWIVMRRRVS